jgi:hypothetical protein
MEKHLISVTFKKVNRKLKKILKIEDVTLLKVFLIIVVKRI